MRRALGFKLDSRGPRLMSFIGFCEDRGATTVTTDLAVEWATTTSRGSDHEAYQARRLDVVRIFARHLQPLDPATEVPPGDVLDRRQCRVPPYLYSPQEVTALMAAARTLRPAFRAVTWRTLIGLLAVTGMRQGEACRLRRDDVDLNEETIAIEDSKFGKSRMVFLHPTTAAALRAYDRARDEAFPGRTAGTFLVNSLGRPLDSAQHPQDVRRARRGGGHQGPARAAGPEAARPAARLHRLDAAGLVSRRRGRPGPAPGPVHLARARRPEVHLLVPLGRPGAPRPGRRQAGARRAGRAGGVMTDLAPVLQGFFTDRLARQKKASPNTVAAYRDTCRLLLAFARDQTGKAPSQLSLADLDAALVGAFLSHLEEQRGNGSATRNARLAAIHSLFKYAAPKAPEHAAVISQVLAIPPRRRERAIVSYLTAEEIDALVAAPGRETWHGRRDHALLLLDVQTGLRVSELTGLNRQDIHLGAGPHVRCHGKGRKDRATPLTSPDRQGDADLARRARARSRRAAVPHPARRPALPRRRRAPRRQARRHRRRRLPVDQGEARHPAYAAALRRHDAPEERRRHLGHRSLARPRRDRNHPDLPSRRHDHQGTGPRPRPAARHQPRPLPATRQPARVPRQPLATATTRRVMPTQEATTRPPGRASAARSA